MKYPWHGGASCREGESRMEVELWVCQSPGANVVRGRKPER